MTSLDRAMLQTNLDTLTRIGERIGDWTDKVDARTSGVSIHIKFQNAQPDAMIAVEFARVMQSCPAMLADAIRRLLALTEDGVSDA